MPEIKSHGKFFFDKFFGGCRLPRPPHAPASCSEIVSRPGNNLVQIRAADRTSGRGQLKPDFDGAA